jgi:hypothetical protein
MEDQPLIDCGEDNGITGNLNATGAGGVPRLWRRVIMSGLQTEV